MNDKVLVHNESAIKTDAIPAYKYKELNDSDVESIMSGLGSYEEMTHEQLLDLSEQRHKGYLVSDIVLEERNEGY